MKSFDNDIEVFNDSYNTIQRIHRAWLGVVWTASAILISLFALATSLQSLKVLGIVAAIVAIPYMLIALQYIGKNTANQKTTANKWWPNGLKRWNDYLFIQRIRTGLGRQKRY